MTERDRETGRRLDSALDRELEEALAQVRARGARGRKGRSARGRRGRGALVLVGIALLACALGLTGYNAWENDAAGRESRAALEALEALMAEPGQAGDGEVGGAYGMGGVRAQGVDGTPGVDGIPSDGEAPDADGDGVPDATAIPDEDAPEATGAPGESDDSAEYGGYGPMGASGRWADAEAEVPDYVLNPNMEMPRRMTRGYAYIATLELPTLKLTLPIMSTWDYHRLRIAPCRYAGSAYRDNLVIAGHNYRSHFGRLASLRLGDAVRLRDMAGNEFRYRVAEVTTLSPRAVEEMTNGGYALTLFTCTVGGQSRVTVRCERVA